MMERDCLFTTFLKQLFGIYVHLMPDYAVFNTFLFLFQVLINFLTFPDINTDTEQILDLFKALRDLSPIPDL